MSIHALTEKAMVCNMSVSMWQGYRLDKEASRKVTEDAGANRDAARVNKHLVPKEALAPIVTATSAVRSHFYENTLPWRDNGDRLLPRALYMRFIQTHEALVREFDEAVETFLVRDYPLAISQAEFRMGELFNPHDYPSARELRSKFAIALDIDAVTTANDFRVAIDAEHVARVRSQMERAAEARLAQAQADVWKRIGDVVGRLQERMVATTTDGEGNVKPAVFRDSTVENVHDLLELIPGLNVLDDPGIETVRALIESKLGGIEAKEIRKDADHRAEIAEDAQEILDRMSGFMNAFGAPVREAA